ncbi:hypothetical protein V8B97DRAFT_1870991 [Scleroderma yunnanense]
MPKRIPTPPPGDDEPKYLSVVHPYAREGYCNMELQQDRQDFARWVACCIDKDAFFAVFHKPSARDTVIIEVNRDCPHLDRILGEHRWSEFLRKPSSDEKDRVTQVFYCSYNTGRMVQKYGWKRIYVDETWFIAWSPNNSLITYPYPTTHFCDVPVEDATNHPICRPLPGATKPPEPEVIKAPKPVVGSVAWHTTKATPATSGATPKSTSKQRGAPKTVIPPVSNVKKPVTVPRATPGQTRGPAVGGGPFVVKASNVWHANNTPSATRAAPPADNWDSSSSVSGRSTPARPLHTSATNTSTTTANQVPAVPPGLPPKKAWANGPPLSVLAPTHPTQSSTSPGSTKSSAPSVPDRAVNSSADSYWSTSTSASTPDTEPNPNDISSDPGMVHVEISESFEEMFHGLNIKEYATKEDSDDGLAELDSIAPGSWGVPIVAQGWDTTDTEATGGWGDVPQDAESQWKESQKEPEKQLCKVHGVICKKGICQEYAKQVREEKRAEKRAKEMEERTAKKGKNGNRGRGAAKVALGRGSGPSGGTNVQSSPFRGSGAPVKTNWRGTPRAIVSPAAIEQREAASRSEEPTTSGWGDDDDPDEVDATAQNPANDTTSNDGWNVSEASYDPWSSGGAPAKQGKGKNAKHQQKNAPKKPMTWAEQVEAASAGETDDTFSVVNNKSSKRRGGRKADDAKSSTSGWGTISEMHW